MLIGIGWLLLTPPDTALRYLGEVWTAGHGFIFLALFAPLPLVDGGVILKWGLVMGGRREAAAETWLRRLGLGLGLGLLAVGVFFLAEAAWLLGGFFLVVGLAVVAAALEIIR